VEPERLATSDVENDAAGARYLGRTIQQLVARFVIWKHAAGRLWTERSGRMGVRERRVSEWERIGSNDMTNRQNRVQRQGRVYRFLIAGTEYAAFIWQSGKQFRGRIEGNPQVPQCTGRTAQAVLDMLQRGLAAHAVA